MKCASEGTCLVVGLDDGCRMLVVDKVRIRGNMFGGAFARMLYVKRCEEGFCGRVGDKLKL